jgi:hypothetical protein
LTYSKGIDEILFDEIGIGQSEFFELTLSVEAYKSSHTVIIS